MNPCGIRTIIDRDGSGTLKTEGKVGGVAMTAYCAYAVPLTAVTVATLSFVPPLYSQGLGLPLATVGAILFAVRLIDIILDPLIGLAIDRSHFKQQHKPWIWIALPVFLTAITLLFFPVKSLVGAPYLFIAAMLTSAAYTTALIAHQAWAAAIATEPRTLSKLFGWREIAVILGIFGTFGATAVAEQIVGPGITVKAAAAGGFILVAIVVSTLITSLFAPDERRTQRHSHEPLSKHRDFLLSRGFVGICLAILLLNLGWVSASVIGFFMAEQVFGMGGRYALGQVVFFLAGGLGMVVWMKLAGRLGDKRALIVASVYTAAAFLCLFLWGRIGTSGAYFAYMASVGLAFGSGPYLVRSLVGAQANAYEAQTGRRVRGMAFSVVTLFDKVGTGMAAGVVLPLVAWLGFNPTAQATAHSIGILLTVGITVPVVSLCLMALTLRLGSRPGGMFE